MIVVVSFLFMFYIIAFGCNINTLVIYEEIFILLGWIKYVSKRITVMLDDDILKKLRLLQSKQIKDQAESVSFSKVINETLQKSFKH